MKKTADACDVSCTFAKGVGSFSRPAQKTNQTNMNITRKLAMIAVLLTASIVSSFAALQWGGQQSTLNWSFGNNWASFPTPIWGVPPGPGDVVYFEDQFFPAGST